METEKYEALYKSATSVHQPLAKAPTYYTVSQFCFNNPAFTELSLRNLIFKANERESSKGLIAGNGLLEIGAIIRIGRKVLIKESNFYAWIEAQNRAS